MTVHQRSGELRCHHCGYVERVPRHCPKCGKVDLRPVGNAWLFCSPTSRCCGSTATALHARTR
jgi:hypothetical protein